MSKNLKKDVSNYAALKRLAMSSVTGDTGELPLKGPEEGEDWSDGGRFWIKFKQASGAQKEQFGTSVIVERMLPDGDGMIERTFSTARAVRALIEMRLIKDAVLPGYNEETDEFYEIHWPTPTREQLALLDSGNEYALSLDMIHTIYRMAQEALLNSEEQAVVGELKNSFVPGEKSLPEALPEVSSNL